MSDNGDQGDLLTRILLDQSDRWRRGQPQSIEIYLRNYPALLNDEEVLLDLISNELFLRTSRGETPDLDEYRRRFPHLAGAMAIQFALHQAVGADSQATALLRCNPTPSAPAGSKASTPPLDVPGYEICGELGRGAMGVVYKARHLRLGRVVALKVILGVGRDAQAPGARFRAEAEVVARLQHSNIVQIFEVGEHAGPVLDRPGAGRRRQPGRPSGSADGSP